ncbi:hypothetical protein C8R46DRAFT_438151 [Mycena filopes]|nr:hypothetical protein C8R46DRAFT_438151 [Mycena filopes]
MAPPDYPLPLPSASPRPTTSPAVSSRRPRPHPLSRGRRPQARTGGAAHVVLVPQAARSPACPPPLPPPPGARHRIQAAPPPATPSPLAHLARPRLLLAPQLAACVGRGVSGRSRSDGAQCMLAAPPGELQDGVELRSSCVPGDARMAGMDAVRLPLRGLGPWRLGRLRGRAGINKRKRLQEEGRVCSSTMCGLGTTGRLLWSRSTSGFPPLFFSPFLVINILRATHLLRVPCTHSYLAGSRNLHPRSHNSAFRYLVFYLLVFHLLGLSRCPLHPNAASRR